MKKFSASLKQTSNQFLKRLPSERKLPFFTLSFTLTALIVTIIAVQQQQNLIQNAAEREICDDNGNSIEITQGPEVSLSIHTTDNPPAVITQGSTQTASAGLISATERTQLTQGIQGQLIVKYKQGKSKKNVEDKVKKRKGKLKKRHDRIKIDVVQVPAGEEAATINELKQDGDVEYVERDAPAFTLYTPNDKYFPIQYALNNTGQVMKDINATGTRDVDIDAPEAWDKTQGGVKVAVIDSGIDQNHPDLKGQIASSENFSGTSTMDDNFGHGTFVAGIIAAKTNNGEGIAGVCPKCTILNAKVGGDDGKTTSLAPIADAIHWAVDQGAKVINISMGTEVDSETVKKAVDYAWSKGVVVVAAAGNCGSADTYSKEGCTKQNPLFYPAAYENTIAVASIDYNGNLAATSERGNWVDVAAPGVQVGSTTPTKQYNMAKVVDSNGKVTYGPLNYAYLSGTSFASPQVAGIAALAISSGIKNASDVRNKIENTSAKITGSGSTFAHGLVKASQVVGASTATDEPEPSDASVSGKPKRNKTPKPTKVRPCKPNKGNTDNGGTGNGATQKPNKNGGKNKKTPTPARNDDRKAIDPKNALCRMLPSIPMCQGGNNNRNNSGSNTPCTTQPNKKTNNQTNQKPPTSGGSGKNGQENTSNKESNVNIGNIDNDGTSNTRVTINGKDVTNQQSSSQSDGKIQNIGDINTGGQTGGNHQTNININGNGQDQTSDKSGTDGNSRNNQPGNNGKGNNNDDCGNNNTSSKNNDKNNKGKTTKASGNPVRSLLCRFVPNLPKCDGGNDKNDKNNKKNNKDDKKNDNNNKKDKDKKNDDEKKDPNDKKDDQKNNDNKDNSDNKKKDDNTKKDDSNNKDDESSKKNDTKKRDDTSGKKDQVTTANTESGAISILNYSAITTCIADPSPTVCTVDTRAQGDISGDGQVDLADYNLFIRLSRENQLK